MQQQVLFRNACQRAHQRGQEEVITVCLRKNCEKRLSCINCQRDGYHSDHLGDVCHLDLLPLQFEKKIADYKNAGIFNIINMKKKEFQNTLNELENDFLKSMERVESADELLMESINMVESKNFHYLNESHAEVLVFLQYYQLEDQCRKFTTSIFEELKNLNSSLVGRKKSEMITQFLKNHCNDKYLLSAFSKNRLNYDNKFPPRIKLIIEEKVQELNDTTSSYFGGIHNGMKQGNGIWIDKVHKEIFEGIWEQNQMIWGQKIMKTEQKCFSLKTGEFHNGELDSNGLILFSNGDNYDCEFRNVQMEQGSGIFQYSNGDYYEGEYKKDCKEGRGILIYKNKDNYTGQFKNNKMEGKGIFKYANRDIYEGEYKNDKKHGKGVFIYSNGDIYDGEYQNDYKEGKGIFKYSNGDIYDGEYKNDKKNGQFTIQYSNNEYFKGYFVDDKKEGIGHYISSDNTMQINFINLQVKNTYIKINKQENTEKCIIQ